MCKIRCSISIEKPFGLTEYRCDAHARVFSSSSEQYFNYARTHTMLCTMRIRVTTHVGGLGSSPGLGVSRGNPPPLRKKIKSSIPRSKMVALFKEMGEGLGSQYRFAGGIPVFL